MADYRINTSDELYHHGVLGMKWGVRRYQNYNGSYTQAGLKRYEKSASTYEDLKAKKKQYGSRTMMDSRTTYGRATKLAKQRMKKDYKHLKQDKLADQGKNLYYMNYYAINTSDTLQHHGVLGMKWGVRRYQNKDGSLTDAGRKKVSKEYKKVSRQANRSLLSQYDDMQINAYNHTVDYFNRNKITEKFNEEQEKKYGENYTKRDGYREDYEKMFETYINAAMAKQIDYFYKNDESVKKGRELVKKYDMTSWDDLAAKNENRMKRLNETMTKLS